MFLLTLKSGVVASSLHMLNQIIRRMIGIVSLIILARVLTPEDFGLVAIALLFLNFVNVVTEIGGQSYLLSREKIDDQQVMSNWTLKFLINNSVALLLAVCSVSIANFYDDTRLIPIILVFSVQIFVTSISSPGLVYLHKHQKLGALTRWQIASRFITTGITIAIALIFKTYWALVIGQFLVALSGCIASYVVAPLKPKFTVFKIREQWEFSKWIMPQSIINFFRSQVDAIFVSAMFDKATMGAYNSMRYYANIPATLFIQPIISATLTQFSEFKNIPTYLARQLQVTFFAFATISGPIIFLIMKHDYILVGIILGDKWVDYSALLGTFSMLVFLTALNSILSQIVMLKDKTRLLLVLSLVYAASHGILFFVVDFKDVYQVANYKILLDVVLACLSFFFVVLRLLGFQALWILTQPILLSLCILYIASNYTFFTPELSHEIYNFIFQCLSFCIVYCLVVLASIYLLKNKIYCFSYISSKLNLAIKKLNRSK